VFFLGQFLIYKILIILSSPLIKAYSKFLSKGKVRIILFSSVFGFFKGLIIILIVFIGVSAFNNTVGKNNNISIFKNIKGYSEVERLMATNRPVISYEEYEKYGQQDKNVIVYYNGVTLDQGIKSSDSIDKKALDLVSNAKSDREKAKRIYAWVGSNLEYDVDKANKALSNDDISNSGAREAFETRRGICFDYACLYVAMAKKVDLKVRIITGQGFNGTSYGPHAWNEVYLKDEGVWIKVDPTFYFAGDYFDNEDFDKDHVKESIAGEW
ncbi:MAG: transglutaminase-like domain-containing protein, partial [Clostridium sp.]